MSEGISEFRAVTILDMKDGEITKVEIEGMDGNFVKASDGSKKSRRKALFNPKVGEEEPEEITIDGKELAEVMAPSVHSFKNGDKVRLISGGGEHPLIGYKNGKTYQVDSHGTWGVRDPDKFVRIVGGLVRHGFAKPEQLEFVEEKTEEEAEESELKVGDYAKFTEDEFEHRKGEIVKLVEDISDTSATFDFELEKPDGTDRGYATKRVLAKATPVDIITAHWSTWSS